jgi:hypothetical protein
MLSLLAWGGYPLRVENARQLAARINNTVPFTGIKLLRPPGSGPCCVAEAFLAGYRNLRQTKLAPRIGSQMASACRGTLVRGDGALTRRASANALKIAAPGRRGGSRSADPARPAARAGATGCSAIRPLKRPTSRSNEGECRFPSRSCGSGISGRSRNYGDRALRCAALSLELNAVHHCHRNSRPPRCPYFGLLCFGLS